MWEEDKSMRWRFGCRMILGLALVALGSACGGAPAPPAQEVASLDTPDIKAALEGIHGDQIKQHMSVLADDKLEGRGLGSRRLRGGAAATSRRR